jgi:ribulose-phosphate 3-epimerase
VSSAPSGQLEQLKALCPTLSVGVLSADLSDLGRQVEVLREAGVQVLHVDVMDGCFVPQMTAGPPLLKALKGVPLLKDAHLMIDRPLNKVADYVAAGADIVTVHLESEPAHIHRVLQQVAISASSAGREVVRGIALNPGTPVDAVAPLLAEVEMVLLLAINPGWGGQKLSPEVRPRLDRARELIAAAGRTILTCIDGGVTRENIGEIGSWGADLVVTGSAVFEGKTIERNFRSMFESLRKGR